MEWIKVLHLLAVLGWMTGIFAVPRAIIFWKREYARLEEFGPTGDLTIRIYRFSLGLGVIGALSDGLGPTQGTSALAIAVFGVCLAAGAASLAIFVWTAAQMGPSGYLAKMRAG